METDTTGRGIVIFRLDAEHKDFLGLIRHWTNLEMAMDHTKIWLKGISEDQAKDEAFLSIPFLESFTIVDDKLFPKGKKVPLQPVPENLHWELLYKALPIQFPKQNHNFFGVGEKVKINLVPSASKKEPIGMMTTKELFKNYVLEAPKVRLQNLKWIVMNHRVLVIGTPVLPIQGQTFWQQGRHFLPTGYDLEYPILSNKIAKKITTNEDQVLVWNKDGQYALIGLNQFRPLSIGSLRLTFKKWTDHAS